MPKMSRSEIVVHALDAAGIAFWAVIIIRTLLADPAFQPSRVIGLGIVLAAAHAVISASTRRRSNLALNLTWLVTVADVILALSVTPAAWLLVGASIVLLLAGYACRREWARTPLTTEA